MDKLLKNTTNWHKKKHRYYLSITEKSSMIWNHPCGRLQKWPWFSTPYIQATCNVTRQIKKGLRSLSASSWSDSEDLPHAWSQYVKNGRGDYFVKHPNLKKRPQGIRRKREICTFPHQKNTPETNSKEMQIRANRISDKELICRIHNELLELNNKKATNLIKK